MDTDQREYEGPYLAHHNGKSTNVTYTLISPGDDEEVRWGVPEEKLCKELPYRDIAWKWRDGPAASGEDGRE